MGIKEIRGRVAQLRQTASEAEQEVFEFNLAAAQLMGDLRYPVSKSGTRIDMSYFSPILAYHLARAGWRRDESKRQIKSRKLTARGLVDDAIEWVPMDAPDDPLKNIGEMTMDEVNKLPPVWRSVAMRRLGGPETPELPAKPQGWHVTTKLQIEDSPDPDDGYRWTGRKTGRPR